MLIQESYAATASYESSRVLVRPIGLDVVEVGGSHPLGPNKFLNICFYSDRLRLYAGWMMRAQR